LKHCDESEQLLVKICNAKVIPKIDHENYATPITRPPRSSYIPRPVPLEDNKGGMKCSYNSRREWVCEASYEW